MRYGAIELNISSPFNFIFYRLIIVKIILNPAIKHFILAFLIGAGTLIADHDTSI